MRWIGYILLALATGQVVAQDAATGVDLQWQPCTLTAPGSWLKSSAQCSSLTVPENRAEPDGRTIDLNIARIGAGQGRENPDPVFFLAGGPGQAATESYPLLEAAFRHVTEDRSVILVDQRGTGGSNALRCPTEDVSLTENFDATARRRFLRRCLRRVKEHADPRFYHTAVAMDDLDAVRQALGYEQINLVGVSYGTRAAFAYLRQYPEHVRSMVLDGVAPPQIALGFDHAQNLDAALEAQFERCRQSQPCLEAFGDPAEDLASLRQALADGPKQLTVIHPRTAQATELRFDEQTLAGVVRLLAYAPESVSLLPLLLDTAAKGRWEPLAAQALSTLEELTSAIASGMEMSVLCVEDEPFYPDNYDQGAALMGSMLVDAAVDQCRIWPHAAPDPSVKQPITSDVPVLLLSGEYDPVTPPRFAELAAETLSAATHLVVPGQGHNVLPRGCVGKMVADFLATPEQKLDTECVDVLGPGPFFTSFAGPKP